MTRRRWIIAGVVLAVVAACLAIAVPKLGCRHTDSRQCRDIRANVAAAPRTVDAGPTRAYVLGDSWTSGWLLPDPSQGYAYQLARAEHWNARIDGFPSSGYVNPSACGDQRFGARVDRIPRDTQLVVVEGGLNDDAAPEKVQPAAEDLLRSIAKRAPDARIVVIGAPPARATNPGAVQLLDQGLAAAARDTGATVIDTSGWVLPYLPDQLHLTPDGHQQFAALLAQAIGAP